MKGRNLLYEIIEPLDRVQDQIQERSRHARHDDVPGITIIRSTFTHRAQQQ